jgi:tetratricopeptide (TPR) repeat protein
MQLRVPKKYQAQRRRRRLFRSRRWMYLWAVTFVAGYFGYWVLQNPTLAREYAENFAENTGRQFRDRREQFFPDAPTPTPDVRTESIEAENAYRLGDYEQAITLYREVIKGEVNNVNLHFRLAYLLLVTSGSGQDTAKVEEAQQVALQAIAANPESPLGWTIRAMALDLGLQHNRALASAQRALELDPNSIFAKAVLGNIYRNLQDFGLAETTLNEAMEQVQSGGADNETVAQVYRNYGLFLAAVRADYEGATAAYQRARQAMPTLTYITLELASRIYLPLGNEDPSQLDVAISLLEETLTTNPRDPAVLYELGGLYYRQGSYERAAERYEQCIGANPTYILCYSGFGYMEFWVNADFAKTIQYMSEATRLGSTDPYDYYLLARSYYRTQQCSLADKPLRDGLAVIQEYGESGLVTSSDFLKAFTDCQLPQPQVVQPTPTPEEVTIPLTPTTTP